MRISVIIPVYNAALFIEEAVRSALAQPETGEVVLVEDGSTDRSLDICHKLASDPRISVLTHPGGANEGVAASRNLGIAKATMEFIAFLDADDTFLDDRFKVTRSILGQYPDADGVHEKTKAHFINPEFREAFGRKAGGDISGVTITTVPERLFRTLASGRYGYVHLNALTVRASVLKGGIRFDPSLKMSEDVDLVLQLAARHRIYQGDPENIVATRGVHGANSIFNNPDVLHYRKQYLQKCVDQKFYGSGDILAALYIVSRRVGASRWFKPFRKLGKLALPFKLAGIAGYLIIRPGVVLNLIRIVMK